MSLEKGKSLVDQMLAKLPDVARAAVQPYLTDVTATDALTLLGAAADDRATTEKVLADLKAKEAAIAADEARVVGEYEKLKTWYDGKKTDLDAYEAIKKGQQPPVTPPVTPPTPTPGTFTRDEVEKMLLERDQVGVQVMAITSSLASQHLHRFQEPLDVNAVIDHARKNQISLADAYKDVHKEKIAAADKAIEDARIAKLVEERLAAERKNAAQPFPLRGGPEASPLDTILRPATEQKKYDVDSAVEAYERLTTATPH